MKKFLDRSASFFGQETHEHVKPLKTLSGGKQFHFYHEHALKKVCFLYVFLRFPHFGSKTDFLMKFLNDSAWLCLEKLKNICFQPKTFIFDKNQTIQSKIKHINQKLMKIQIFLGFPVVLWTTGTVKLKVPLP